jgi:hypothetical protein
MFFRFEALAQFEGFKEILDIIRREWGFMLRNGATTCWEVFPGFMKDSWTRSWCHGWGAAPAYFLSTYQLGVRILEPGCKKVLIAPEPAGLTWVKGSFPTPSGNVEVSWEFTKDREFLMQVQLPQGTAGDVIIPVLKEKIKMLKMSGERLGTKRLDNGRWVIPLQTGGNISISAKLYI